MQTTDTASTMRGRRRPMLAAAAVALGGLGFGAALAHAEAGAGDQTVVNLYAKPTVRHPELAAENRFRMLSFSEAGAEHTGTSYSAVATFGVAHGNRVTHPLVTKHVSGHTAGRTTFSVRLSATERARLRDAAHRVGRRAVLVEIQPTPHGAPEGPGRRLGERRDWPLLLP